MKIKNISKKVLVLALSAMFVCGGFEGVFAAEKATEEPTKKVVAENKKTIDANENKDTVFNMPLGSDFNVNVVSKKTGNGFLAIDISDQMFTRSKKEPKPLELTLTSGGESYKVQLVEDYGVYRTDYNSDDTMRRMLIPCRELSSAQITIKNPNTEEKYAKEFEKEFRMRVYTDTYKEKDNVLTPAPELGDINKNNIKATISGEDKEIYEGFIFGDLNGKKVETFFMRPNANSSRIRLNIGAMYREGNFDDISGFDYDYGDFDRYKVEFFDTEKTYNDIVVKWKDKDDYSENQYKEEELSIGDDSSVDFNWYPGHSIIKVTLISPNIFLNKMYVEEINDNIDFGGISGGKYDNESNSSTSGSSSHNTAEETINASTRRFSGANRYDTALELSKKVYNKSDVAVIASGENFADALSGGPLANISDAPLLLMNSSSVSNVQNELNRLGVKKVYVLGGDSSISKKDEFKITHDKNNKLREVIRLDGKNRYETSMKIYNEFTKFGGSSEKPILVNGHSFADALSAGPLAAKEKRAVVLTDGHNLMKPLSKTDSKNIIIGGYTSMDRSFSGGRYSGKNRYDTAAEVAKAFHNPKNVMISSGETYPDGLASITLYKKYEAPLLLTRRDSLPSVDKNYIKDKSIDNIYIVGGTSSVSDKVKNIFK